MDVAGTTILAYAKAFTAKSAGKLAKFSQNGVAGALGCGKFVLDHNIGVSVFPNDAKLTQLPWLTAEFPQQLLQQIAPERSPLPSTNLLHSLHYKPERRYVAMFTRTEAQVVLKAYTTDYLQAKANAQAFASGEVLQIVPKLRDADTNRVIVFKWLSETNLSAAMTANAVALTGIGLSELHAQFSVNLPECSRETEAMSLLVIATDLNLICPQFGKLAQNLAIQLATQLQSQPAVNYPIHGDFNASQVLVGDNYVTFLDFDRAGLGDRATDLGSFIARLEYDVLRGKLSPSQVATLSKAFLAGYCSRSAAPERIELYTAIALLRLAFEPFRYRETNWCDRTEAILLRVRELISS